MFPRLDAQFLVPILKPGDAVMLDNLGPHKGKGVRKAIRAVAPGLFCRRSLRPQPHRAGLRQLKTLAAKGRSLPKLRGDLLTQAGGIAAQYPPAECAEILENAGYG